MSFNFPSLKSIQDTISSYDFEKITKSTEKTYQGLSKTIQPFTHKTQEYLHNQLHQIQQFAIANPNVEVSELPEDYLQLEASCDLLLKLYTDLIQFTTDTYGKVSYDYPPANNSLVKLRDNVFTGKFNQLKNVSSPQELENLLLGKEEKKEPVEEDSANVQVIDVPKTLYGQLSKICGKYQEELKTGDSPLNFALLQISEAYLELANGRLVMDQKIMASLNHKLVEILNEEFIKVTELRKSVYAARQEFDLIRAKSAGSEEEEEDDELIKKEDELVSATENAVIEMKQLIQPSKSVNLLKVFVEAQREWFEASAKRLSALSASLDKISFKDEE
ncbi:hypothetical protein PSN45_000068 [Yamadazyma tenuis]|uniref:BAR domain-containing protein n=1 Tax=Candida tenuis (strain ATCC 10573 / BCRC 21748 / CBS 615 / JCM 9827 / NBRC 10315 / NRRL Y-1498 / VKM Y-70) TaxID=590646 RepID=G3BAA8_CANTC|nr:uncharacterized protein CANTEDRAFT_109736 [Yamadazyma tenuis ATCC 10573]XP_006687566.1 uncharacterized protein CANTEDRAFT_109736 [Yamadazyma tenuis ATCC 10573]EGV61395.1 hypothetical protein CANTEDRAFT_109736 [Yamadazyma tenuis ATCC 10573]EGV61396.1 hypothetical protein CANTEDRAFT_109736 [Yamadazyma tenuis ATCC 10573]WEJ92615.1 hypothetical protein PSN45_000068 [Yamadazyma tenuis]